jgi:hypothetical protein
VREGEVSTAGVPPSGADKARVSRTAVRVERKRMRFRSDHAQHEDEGCKQHSGFRASYARSFRPNGRMPEEISAAIKDSTHGGRAD